MCLSLSEDKVESLKSKMTELQVQLDHKDSAIECRDSELQILKDGDTVPRTKFEEI